MKSQPKYYGNYHMVNEQMKEGKSERRTVSLYTNWNASNPDPHDL